MSKSSPHSTVELRKMNRNRVFQALYHTSEPLTKQELAYRLSMSLPTLTQNLSELMAMGLVDNSEVAGSSGGRKPRILSVVPGARWALGVEISSRHIRLVALDLQVRELGFRAFDLPFHTGEEYAVRLAQTVECFIDELGLDRAKLLGVGVSIPGIVDAAQQYVTTAPTLGVRRLDVRAIAEHIPYPVYLVNDANAGGFAECWGRSGVQDMAYLSLSRGVGGAILTSGTAYLGANGRSGEFGHMCIHPGGAPCSCGRRGCLEAYCSTARLSDDMGITLEDFFQALAQGHAAYSALWERYLDDLAVGILNIHAALDCQIVLGGKLSRFMGERFSAIDGRLRRLDPAYQEGPYLAICRYYDHSNGIGAALYFVDRFIRQI
ncbi:ROK family transcriptional regulator [uncultured Pseudoflavonifractor sp.]|uniref:ROK family transcriptional regulator n=1 Tax=uncultured Pseudoflavonifractor sp. TaxID=1221379 RepID=UPI0025E519B2|nr:ROK family transcriptional regulator [uncultured Pseudoflavonifractor sp.]